MGVNINGPSRVVYRPDEPLPSLARLWVETDADLEIINHTDSPAPKEG